jgi:hypothetical protein
LKAKSLAGSICGFYTARAVSPDDDAYALAGLEGGFRPLDDDFLVAVIVA